MAPTIPTKEPATFTAGDTLKFKRYHAEYPPADGWTLSYALVADGAQITFSGSDNGDGYHLINVSAATTAGWASGYYRWQAYVTHTSGERHQMGAGEMELKPDFASQGAGYDGRTHVKKTLDALEATLEGKASRDQQSYTINGRSLERMAPGELLKWHSHYKRLYRQERQAADLANGVGGGSTIQVRF